MQMALVMRLVVVLALTVGGSAQQKLSKHDQELAETVMKIVVSEVSQKCLQSSQTAGVIPDLNHVDDAYVDNYCNLIISEKKALLNGGCSQKEYDTAEKTICSHVKASNKELKTKITDYTKVAKKFSSSCLAMVGSPPKLWYDFEQLCLKVKTNQAADFKKTCPDNYSNLKDAACGGASALLAGLVTFGLGLVASLFNKL